MICSRTFSRVEKPSKATTTFNHIEDRGIKGLSSFYIYNHKPQSIPSHKELNIEMSEKLCLQWNDFKENIKGAFGSLRSYNDFSDVTQ